MKIETSRGCFDLPENFQIELSLVSQILTDEGDKSLPVTFPPTDHNLMLVYFSHRVDAKYKPIKRLLAGLTIDAWNSQCEIVIHNVNQEDGIECSLYINRGHFYARAEGIMMQNLGMPVVSSPNYETNTEEQNAQYLIELLKYIHQTPSASTELAIAPIITSEQIKEVFGHPNSPRMNYKERTLILNGFSENSTPVIIYNNEHIYYMLEFEAEYTRKIIIDNAVLDAHPGYGMTPFLKLFYVLDFLFDKFDYTFNNQNVRSEVEANTSIVILNNVVDAIYTGKLDYNQLLPPVTVKEFLKEVELALGGQFAFNETDRTVTFVMYKNWNRQPEIDYTEYLASEMKITESDFTTLDLKNNVDPNHVDEPETEYISLSMQAEGSAECEVMMTPTTGGTPELQVFPLKSVKIDGVVRKNTNIEIEGVIQDNEKEDKKEPIRFASVRNLVGDTYSVMKPPEMRGEPFTLLGKVNYKRAYASIYKESETPLEYARGLYSNFFEFNKDSNMQVEVKTCFPPDVLFNLDLNKSVLFNGIPFLIEKINFAIPFKGENQTTVLRTLKTYEDLPQAIAGEIKPIIRWQPNP